MRIQKISLKMASILYVGTKIISRKLIKITRFRTFQQSVHNFLLSNVLLKKKLLISQLDFDKMRREAA